MTLFVISASILRDLPPEKNPRVLSHGRLSNLYRFMHSHSSWKKEKEKVVYVT